VTFKDIPINSYFVYEGRGYKKIDFNNAINTKNLSLREFELYDEVEVTETFKFQLNY